MPTGPWPVVEGWQGRRGQGQEGAGQEGAGRRAQRPSTHDDMDVWVQPLCLSFLNPREGVSAEKLRAGSPKQAWHLLGAVGNHDYPSDGIIQLRRAARDRGYRAQEAEPTVSPTLENVLEGMGRQGSARLPGWVLAMGVRMVQSHRVKGQHWWPGWGKPGAKVGPRGWSQEARQDC